MSFHTVTPRSQKRPQMMTRSTPSSGYGRSPSPYPPSYTTDDLANAKYSRYARAVEWLRIFLSIITLAISVAVTACAGDALRAYSKSRVQPEWLLPLWPQNVDLRPTRAMLGCGIAIVFLSLVYLAAAFAPLVSRQYSQGNRKAALNCL